MGGHPLRHIGAPLRMATIGALFVLAPALTWAQGIDGHGQVLPPIDDDAEAPLTVHAPWSDRRGAYTVGALLELIDAPVTRYLLTGPTTWQQQAALDNVAAVDLSARYAISERVGLGASVPLFVAAGGSEGRGGPALGDLHLWVPVGLIRPDPDSGDGPGFSLTPWLDLPTGAPARLLGDDKAAGGLLAATGYGQGALATTLNLGLRVAGDDRLPNQSLGGAHLDLGASVGAVPQRGVLGLPEVGVHLEARARVGLADDAHVAIAPDALDLAGDTAGAPVELHLTVKGRLAGGQWFGGGVGRGVTAGVGAANARVFAGGGLWHDDGAREVVIAPRELAFRVVDPAGVPVPDARIVVGGREVGASGGDGIAHVDRPRWRRGVEITATGFEDLVVPEPDASATELDVVLTWVPRTVRLRIQDERGVGVPAEVIARPIDAPDATAIRTTATTLDLPPGTFTIAIQSPGFGTQTRTVVVPGAGPPPPEVDVVLLEQAGDADLAWTIHDPDGAPIAGARMLLDGLPVGSTAAGASAVIASLAPGIHTVEVLHEDFSSERIAAVELKPGINRLDLTLHPVPGTVRVRVVGPTGDVVPDAVLRFDGPRRLGPMPVGGKGVRTEALGPGTWDLFVSSASHGIQQRQVVIPPERHELVDVEVVLQPVEGGVAELRVVVVDPEGHPLEGVEVLLDGASVGRTSTGGTLRVGQLRTGERNLTVSGERFRERSPRALTLVEGLTEQVLTLRWRPGTVQVRTRTPEAPVRDATVRFVGPASRPTVPIGPTGAGTFELPAGQWAALLVSETSGVAQRDFVVPDDSDVLLTVDVVLNPPEEGLASLDLRVANPEGQGVPGAMVAIDGSPLGATTNTGSLALEGLSVGVREVSVTARPYLPVTEEVRLLEGGQEQEVVLDWGPGAVRISVTAEGEPVTDAIVRTFGPDGPPLPPAPVDAWGERLLTLSPGNWQVLVISERWGMAQRELMVDETSELIEMRVSLHEISPELCQVLVRAVSGDDTPLVGATVTLDGTSVGATGDGGALLLQDLPPGPAEITVTAPHHAAHRPVDLTLSPGAQERILRLEPLPVELRVEARDTTGAPLDAEVRIVGRLELAPVSLGRDGGRTLQVPPGRWQVVAATEALGPASAAVELAPGAPASTVTLTLTPSRVAVQADAVAITDKVSFDLDEATLRPDAAAVLAQVASAVLANPRILRVQVQGHTDNTGSVAYNQDLSQRRAQAVVDALIDLGVPPEILRARGYGTQRPIADNATDAGRAANRRVEFRIVERHERQGT